MKHHCILLAVAVGLFFSQASASEWKADKVHSHVNFAVTHNLISEVQGTFSEYDVAFTSEKEDFTDAAVEVTIKTASIFTRNEKRDGHLKSDDFFGVEAYPEMRFKSTRFEPSGEGRYRIHGDLTIRDVTQPIILEATHTGTIQDERMGTRVGFKATGRINRFDFNLKWNAVLEAGGLIVSKDVDIIILMELIKQ